MRPVIALLSDFGTRDHYAGTMKGVILGICPEATIVDITHEISPHDIRGGALQLASSYRYFPAATTFLAIVDPGVGSARRALAAEGGDYRFVGPDNGILSAALGDAGARQVVEVTERRYALPAVSRTFEGRDRFAPAAAWLATGVPLAELGRVVSDYHQLDIPAPREDATGLAGEVLAIDRFGNLISNIGRDTFDRAVGSRAASVQIAGTTLRLVDTYADVPEGEACALFGSGDRLEISVRCGSAASVLSLARGAGVRVVWH